MKTSTFHRGPRKIITVFHQEILLLKKLRKLYGPGGGKGYEDRFAVFNLTARSAVEGTGGSP
jgi:hypothetical protein